jgi:hypothetical protein
MFHAISGTDGSFRLLVRRLFTTQKHALSFFSVLCLLLGPRTEHDSRCSRLRDAVQWLGPPVVAQFSVPVVHRCCSHHFRHGCALQSHLTP